ncbi:MAG: hypothetical protein J5802_08160 [Butyrivibrio sp.]|nr:hypothetical protein [Butyrivibrio sp.]
MVTSDEEYIKTWRESHPGGLNPFPEEGKYLTIRGEKVRSKSEKILADYFEKLGIPYSYEPQVKLKDGRTFYPDFVLLNVRTRRTIYWEHFGLISDFEYAKNAFIKLGLFEKAGLEIGKDILFSMEDARQPLNLKQIENKIRANIL